MAHKKAGGSTRNGRDSNPQYRGVKCFGGEWVNPGTIIIRQVGTKIHPGRNVKLARDFTIFSLIRGRVAFERYGKDKKRVSVIPAEAAA